MQKGSVSSPFLYLKNIRKWAFHTTCSPVNHMRIDLSGLEIAMPQLLLYCSYVRAAFEQVGGERMSESMTTDVLIYPCL